MLTWLEAGAGHRLTWPLLVENVHGPLHALLLSMWMSVAGDGEWAMRLPSAVFGTAMVPVMAWLAARWLGRETAPAAAWLTAFSPFLVWYGQEARNYSLVMLCACVSTVLLLEIGRKLTPGRAIGYVAATAAGLLSNFSFAFLAPFHLERWIGAREGRGARLRVMGIGLVAILLIVSPWVASSFGVWEWNRLSPSYETTANLQPERGTMILHPAAIPYSAYAFSVGYTFGPSLRALRSAGPMTAAGAHWPAILCAALLFGALSVAGWRALARRGRRLDLLLWVGVPILILAYGASQSFKVFHPRYLAVVMPAYLLMLAAGFADMRPRWRRLAVAAVAVIWGVALWNLYFVPQYGREDMRGTASLIRAEAAPGEQVIAVYTLESMQYYLGPAIPIHPFWLGFVDRPKEMDARLDSLMAGAEGSWVVLSRSENLDPHDVFARHLAERYPRAREFVRTGVRIWHVRPDSVASF